MASPRTYWQVSVIWLLRIGGLALALALSAAHGAEAVWQWSVPMGQGRAFLWIPEDCRQVRAVIVAQHNMIEQGILEHATMRRTLAALGIAEVFIAPPFDHVFQFDRGAGERFDAIMRTLADESGYTELATAPVVPIGHSACASYPWNFAAWNPGRTLAVLSVKGDAPQTDLTGSGAPNPDWGTRSIDGIPGLMVMSEQEWWEARLAPLTRFRALHPVTPLAVLADTGHGHFDATDPLVEFLAMFIRKAAEARLSRDGSATLRPVDPEAGWLVQHWLAAVGGTTGFGPAPAGRYIGPRNNAFWCFDEEMARAIEAYQTRGLGLRPQQVDFVQDGAPAPISTTHTGVELKFQPGPDGLTFRLAGDFIAPLPPKAPVAAKDNKKQPPPTTVQPRRAADGTHASGAVRISIITGPVLQIAPDTFRVRFDRTASTVDKRNNDIWLFASHPGDATYKGAVQQALLKITPNKEGAAQTINFPAIPDQHAGAASVELRATSDAAAPVSYYVREGPAFVVGALLHLTPLPPRAKLPVKVTVVAWQWGRATEPKLRTAAPVERSFLILP